MKSSSDKNQRFFSLTLLAISLSLLAYALYGYYHDNYVRNYALRPLPVATKEIKAPTLPDISGYTTDALIKMMPAPAKGSVEIVPLVSSTIFPNMAFRREEIVSTISRLQQTDTPSAIEIKSGVYTLDELVDAVANPTYLERGDSAITLKTPIFVHPEATLIVKGQPEKRLELHLAEEGGAFISSFGKVFIADTNITGWRLTKNQPATYVDKDSFRPFLTFWGKSESYIGRTALKNLGFSSPKMYGLSYSSDAIGRLDQSAERGKGWLLDCFIEDLYYGLYTYEASDIAIIRNEFKDNIIYGIDPHDRSRHLIIAYNNSYGAKKRHGIIVSREVDDSWIFNNHSHNNHGSGFMIDRNSVRNVIANNLSENNGNDGLVFFESPDNISYANTLRNNGKSGIRIRNSWNIVSLQDRIHENKGYALLSYTTSLEDNEAAKATRDGKLDPYGMRVAFDVIGAELNNNHAGNFNLMDTERAGFYGLNIFRSHSGYFEGDSSVKALQYNLYEKAVAGEEGAEIFQMNYTPKYSEFWGKKDEKVQDSKSSDGDAETDSGTVSE